MQPIHFLLPLAALLAPAAAHAQGAAALAPHRAVYDLNLGQASERSGITGISGRMVYEFNGSACEGYTTTFRFVTEINTSEATRVSDQQTTTYEEGDGTSFNFSTKSFVDQALESEVRGHAVRSDSGTTVELDKPQEMDISLAATQFPTQHMIELLTKAAKGERFYQTTLFDGSDKADKVMATSVVIGRRRDVTNTDPEFAALDALASERIWPVDIAYFDLSTGGGEEVPDYRASFKLHENGLTRDLVMDYGDFSMTGRLVDLEMLKPAPACP
jgi:hypothetical protein